jgi:hypothetical protein
VKIEILRDHAAPGARALRARPPRASDHRHGSLHGARSEIAALGA